MSFEPISEEAKARIAGAAPEETNAALAAELGIAERTVRKYRQSARQERKEVAREVLERRVEAEMPNALAALGDCVAIAHAQMKMTRHPDYIRECRSAAKTLLDYLGLAPEKDPHADASDEAVIEELESRGIMRRL